MAIKKRFTQLNNSGSNHNLLDAYSGKITGSLEVTGSAYFPGGLSGSLQMLTDGTTMFLTGAGGVTITNLANGQIEVSSSVSAGAASPEYWSSTTAASIFTTGSVLIRSDDGSGTDAASDYGTDTFFFVSGVLGGIGSSGVAAFGGDLVVSGGMRIGDGEGGGLFVSGNIDVGNPGIAAAIKVATSDVNTKIEINKSDDKSIVISNSNFSSISDDITISSGTVVIRENYQYGVERPVLTLDANTIAYTVSAGGVADTLGITSAGDITLDATDKIFVTASNGMYVGANTVFNAGLTGSLQEVSAGVPYLLAGDYITIATNSLGQIEITGSAGSSSPEYWTSDVANAIWTSGSVLARGGDTTTAASDYGADTFFFVSGAIDGKAIGNGVAAFGGDVVVSGNLIISGVNSVGYPSGLYISGPAQIEGGFSAGTSATDISSFNSQLTASAGINTPTIGSAGGAVTVIVPLTASVGLDLTGNSVFQAGSTFTFNGDGVFAAGLTGSLQEVSAGVPYLLAGDYITIATNSLGQIAISASNLPATEVYWTSDVANNIFTTGSAVISSSLSVNPAGTGRGLLRVGGLDIGPITGSLYMTYTDGTETGILNGNVLSASNGVWDGTNTVVLRHEVHVLGLGYGAYEGGPTQMFAATYLIMSYIDSSGVQSVQAVTELSRETSGSLAAGYDINFSPNGNIEASASLDSISGIVVWYAQRVKEMSLSYDLSIT